MNISLSPHGKSFNLIAARYWHRHPPPRKAGLCRGWPWPSGPAGRVDYRTITPMQRPLELGMEAFFASDEEGRPGKRPRNRRRIATRRTGKRAGRPSAG